MANKCPECGSVDVQSATANDQCLNCGSLFADGKKVEIGMDDSTRAALEARMAPRKTVVTGNLADLQRLGAEAAVHGTGPLADVVVLPPGLSKEDAITPAEDDAAKGLVTTETVRTGEAEGIIKEQEAIAAKAQAKADEREARTTTTSSKGSSSSKG